MEKTKEEVRINKGVNLNEFELTDEYLSELQNSSDGRESRVMVKDKFKKFSENLPEKAVFEDIYVYWAIIDSDLNISVNLSIKDVVDAITSGNVSEPSNVDLLKRVFIAAIKELEKDHEKRSKDGSGEYCIHARLRKIDFLANLDGGYIAYMEYRFDSAFKKRLVGIRAVNKQDEIKQKMILTLKEMASDPEIAKKFDATTRYVDRVSDSDFLKRFELKYGSLESQEVTGGVGFYRILTNELGLKWFKLGDRERFTGHKRYFSEIASNGKRTVDYIKDLK